MTLLIVDIMTGTESDWKNVIAKELRTSKYRSRVVKPKKGKGSFKRKKK